MPNHSETQSTYESESQDDWLDRFARFNQHFGRFVREALGVLLIATALMTLLALAGYTQGFVLTPWARLLSLWFGRGAYLVVIAIGYCGFAVLRRDGFKAGWGRLFMLEVAAFLTIGLFAAQGNSVLRAEAGLDGGRIGWGIATAFWKIGKTWGNLLMFAFWLLAVATGLGLWAVLERWLLKLAKSDRSHVVL